MVGRNGLACKGLCKAARWRCVSRGVANRARRRRDECDGPDQASGEEVPDVSFKQHASQYAGSGGPPVSAGSSHDFWDFPERERERERERVPWTRNGGSVSTHRHTLRRRTAGGTVRLPCSRSWSRPRRLHTQGAPWENSLRCPLPPAESARRHGLRRSFEGASSANDRAQRDGLSKHRVDSRAWETCPRRKISSASSPSSASRCWGSGCWVNRINRSRAARSAEPMHGHSRVPRRSAAHAARPLIDPAGCARAVECDVEE